MHRADPGHMEGEPEEVEETFEERDVIAEQLDTLSALDPNALLINFVTVVEWIEPDGSPSLSVIGTKMAPWHIKGLLAEVIDDMESQRAIQTVLALDDDEDE